MTAAWYDDRENLVLLLDWLGDMSASAFRGLVEKPWHWETEFTTALAASNHERIHDGHIALKDGTSDTDSYCNAEGCDWRVQSGLSNDIALAVSS